MPGTRVPPGTSGPGRGDADEDAVLRDERGEAGEGSLFVERAGLHRVYEVRGRHDAARHHVERPRVLGEGGRVEALGTAIRLLRRGLADVLLEHGTHDLVLLRAIRREQVLELH